LVLATHGTAAVIRALLSPQVGSVTLSNAPSAIHPQPVIGPTAAPFLKVTIFDATPVLVFVPVPPAPAPPVPTFPPVPVPPVPAPPVVVTVAVLVAVSVAAVVVPVAVESASGEAVA
jgi:hypothetical protein